MARTDKDTGLPSREALCQDLRRRLAEAHRYGTRVSLVLAKVDNLREIYHRHGDQVGRAALDACTRFVCAIMREMDLVARYDTDVFGILMPCTPLVYAAAAGERLRRTAAESPVRVGDLELRLTVSVGVAESQKGDDLESLIGRVTQAETASSDYGGDALRFHTGASIEALPTGNGAG